jgi:hypothetical protein
MAMKKELALTIKLVITLILAVAGIYYILETPPVSSVEDYQKQKIVIPKHQTRSKEISPTKDLPAGADQSLTGKEGRFDNSRIGKQAE